MPEQRIEHTCRYCGEQYVEVIVDGWSEGAHKCDAGGQRKRKGGNTHAEEVTVLRKRLAAMQDEKCDDCTPGADNVKLWQQAEKAERERDEWKARAEKAERERDEYSREIRSANYRLGNWSRDRLGYREEIRTLTRLRDKWKARAKAEYEARRNAIAWDVAKAHHSYAERSRKTAPRAGLADRIRNAQQEAPSWAVALALPVVIAVAALRFLFFDVGRNDLR
jgi:chromosome segregation ATPase